MDTRSEGEDVAAGLPTGEARRAQYGTGLTPRGRQTREKLLVAARTVFERDGFVAARVADIAAEAKVSHGTFYTYFDSKDEAFVKILNKVALEIEEAVGHDGGDVPGDAIGNVERSHRRYLAAYERNAKIYVLMEQLAVIDDAVGNVRALGRERHVERVAARIRRQQDRGVADVSIDADVAAAALVSMLSNFAYWWIGMGNKVPKETAVKTLTQMWSRSLGLRSGPVGAPDD